jgi:hypothetical protein
MKSKKSYQEQKRRNFSPFVFLLLLSPYIVGFTNQDSTSNSFIETSYGIGGGQYIYHDCSGSHKQGFFDAGIYSGKKYEGPYRLGISAGGWNAGEKGSRLFIFPDLALDWKYFSVGTTGVRFGTKSGYLEGKWLDSPPFLSGKGALRMGIGGELKTSLSRYWIGTNIMPYNTPGLALQLEFPLKEKRFLFLNGRYGRDETSGLEEYGLSVGMRVVTF